MKPSRDKMARDEAVQHFDEKVPDLITAKERLRETLAKLAEQWTEIEGRHGRLAKLKADIVLLPLADKFRLVADFVDALRAGEMDAGQVRAAARLALHDLEAGNVHNLRAAFELKLDAVVTWVSSRREQPPAPARLLVLCADASFAIHVLDRIRSVSEPTVYRVHRLAKWADGSSVQVVDVSVDNLRGHGFCNVETVYRLTKNEGYMVFDLREPLR
jgi:hypothetical protein